MLQNIRDKSQGLLAWLIVIVLIATFALWGIHTYVTSEKNSNIVAHAGDQVITQRDVNTVYERLRQQQQLQLGANFSMSQTMEAHLKQQALNQLVISGVLSAAAHKTGYRVTTEQVDEALLQIPAFQVSGQFSLDRFHEILNSILYTQEQFLADMRQSMLISQVEGGYTNSAFALPDEVSTAIRLVNQKRDINYVVIPAARFAKQVKVSESEVKQYYQTHQNKFQSPEQVSVQYLMLSLPQIKSSLTFDKTKLQQYYENNLQNYTKPASWHVAHILIKVPQDATAAVMNAARQKSEMIAAKLKSGADFGAIAKQYSDDKISAAQGGELDWFSAGTLDPSFEKAVANLQHPGDISAPVKTAYGYCVIKLLGVKKAEVLPFAEVQSQVQNTLATEQAQQLFADESDKLGNLTYANPESLEVAAKALNLPIEATGLFDNKGLKTGIAANPRVVAAAFSEDVLVHGNNSDLLQISPDTVVVLHIKDHKPASVLPFADVQNTIQAALINKKAQQQAKTLGGIFLGQLQLKQTTPQQFTKQYALSWQIDNNVGRYDARIDSAILNKAFRMPHPDVGSSSIAGLELSSGDYAVIMVNAVHEGELPPADSVQKHIFAEEIANNFGRVDYELYARETMKRARVKINQAAWSKDSASQNTTP